MHKSCANFMLMQLIPESQIHVVTPSNNYMMYYTEELAGVNWRVENRSGLTHKR